nr:MAG TPA: hypothetical protein [Caudoviricetes sp.]
MHIKTEVSIVNSVNSHRIINFCVISCSNQIFPSLLHLIV